MTEPKILTTNVRFLIHCKLFTYFIDFGILWKPNKFDITGKLHPRGTNGDLRHQYKFFKEKRKRENDILYNKATVSNFTHEKL